MLPAFSYIHCHPIYSLTVFIRRFYPRSHFRFCSLTSVVAFSVVSPLRVIAFRSYWLSVSRLVGRLVMRVVSFRFSSCPCRVVGRRAVFVSSSSSGRLVSPWGVFPRSASCLPFRPPSRHDVPGFPRLVSRLVYCVSWGVSCIGFSSVRLVKAMGLVACFLFYSYTRRFCQLRLPSWRGRGLFRSSVLAWCGGGFLFPCVIASCFLPCVPHRFVSASRPSARLRLAVWRLAPSVSSRRAFLFAGRYRLSPLPHAPFLSARLPRRFLICDWSRGRRMAFSYGTQETGIGHGIPDAMPGTTWDGQRLMA